MLFRFDVMALTVSDLIAITATVVAVLTAVANGDIMHPGEPASTVTSSKSSSCQYLILC